MSVNVSYKSKIIYTLRRLLKEEIIAVKTYIQAKNEILLDINTNKNFQ